MILDVHTHTPQYKDVVPEEDVIWNHAWRPDRAVKATTTWSDYFNAQAPAEKSIVFNIAWTPDGEVDQLSGQAKGDRSWYRTATSEGNLNDATASFVNANPDRLIGFMSIHPHASNCMDEFERCREELGMQGVKLGPNYQSFDPLETRALAIYEQAQKYNMPMMFHQGTSPVRTAPIAAAHPLLMDEIATRYPDLKIIMAHMGHPWQVDTCVVIRKHPNLYADVSGTIYRPFSLWEQLVKASEWNVLDKLLLGSDFPIATVGETIEALRNVNTIVDGTKLPRVPEEAIECIIHRDSFALLDLT